MLPQKIIIFGIVGLTFLFGLWCIITPLYEQFRDTVPLEITIAVGGLIVLICIKFLGKHV